MSNYRRWFLAFLGSGLLVTLAILWYFFAPVQIGGTATYIIVNGSSMEPNFHFGDLVIIRSANQYTIGEEVAYQDKVLGRTVFHRIIDENLNHFVLKGDNNAWTDSYQPTAGEILGTSWIHIPSAGKTVTWMRSPVVLALIAAAVALVIMAIIFIQPKKKMAGNTL